MASAKSKDPKLLSFALKDWSSPYNIELAEPQDFGRIIAKLDSAVAEHRREKHHAYLSAGVAVALLLFAFVVGVTFLRVLFVAVALYMAWSAFKYLNNKATNEKAQEAAEVALLKCQDRVVREPELKAAVKDGMAWVRRRNAFWKKDGVLVDFPRTATPREKTPEEHAAALARRAANRAKAERGEGGWFIMGKNDPETLARKAGRQPAHRDPLPDGRSQFEKDRDDDRYTDDIVEEIRRDEAHYAKLEGRRAPHDWEIEDDLERGDTYTEGLYKEYRDQGL